MSIGLRLRGCGCPYCSGHQVDETNCLATLHPELAQEWHPTKNPDTPLDVTPGSNKKRWWLRPKCNHEWEAAIASRTNGRGCPYCSGNKVDKANCLATRNPKLAKEWHPTKNSDTPFDVMPGSHKKRWWKCSVCGHEWGMIVKNRTIQNQGCAKCWEKRRHEGACWINRSRKGSKRASLKN